MAPRVWIRTFWGFDPENDGFIGFTYPGNRDSFVGLWQPNDLVLIYGGNTAETAPHERMQALGFLQLSGKQANASVFQSPEGRDRKIARGWTERWNNAVEATHAWRVLTPINIQHLFKESLHENENRVRGNRGVLLSENDAERALSLPVREAAVFPKTAPSANRPDGPMSKARMGPPPSFEKAASSTADIGSYVYLLVYDLAPATELADGTKLGSRSIIKAGRSKDIAIRLRTLNASHATCVIPRWKELTRSERIPVSQEAHDLEQKLHADLSRLGTPLTKEMYLIDKDEAISAHAIVTGTFRSHVKA